MKESQKPDPFNRKNHVTYNQYFLRSIPQKEQGLDPNKMMVLSFSIGALRMLAPDDETFFSKDYLAGFEPQEIIDWVLSMQDEENGGFFPSGIFTGAAHPYNLTHITFTYSALNILKQFEKFDPDVITKKVNKKAIVEQIRRLQSPDGSVKSIDTPTSDSDMRYLYCACAVSKAIGDFSGIDTERAVEFIKSCWNYEGGFSLYPYNESHGGSTYCAVASLKMLGVLDEVVTGRKRRRLINWLINKQEMGFCGRTNKLVDTCYSFWIGSSLKILGYYDGVNFEKNEEWILTCQSKYGGFSKWPSTYPDPLHTYLGLIGLSYMDLYGLHKADPLLGIPDV